PLVETQAGLYDRTFLAAIDRALAFAPEERPQSIDEWSKLFGLSLARAHDAPTQRMEPLAAPSDPTPRLGGVSREIHEPLVPANEVSPRRGMTPWILLALAVAVGAAVWLYEAPLLDRVAVLLPQ